MIQPALGEVISGCVTGSRVSRTVACAGGLPMGAVVSGPAGVVPPPGLRTARMMAPSSAAMTSATPAQRARETSSSPP